MKVDRLLGILTVLLRIESGSVTAPYLAEKFEVSRRTISRDIDALCRAGIPIVTRQGGNGGISIAEGYRLDKSVLTAGELSSVIAGLKTIGTVSEKAHIERVLDKLAPGSGTVVSLREPVIINLASHHKGSLTAKIEAVKAAVLENRLIEFDYFYVKGETRRVIEPSFVIFQWMDWYVFGYCLERRDWRMFKLARLWNLRVLEETFSPREIPPERRDFNARFTDEYKLVAIFDPSLKYRLIESYGPECYTETGEGLRLEIGYDMKEFITGWLLAFGDKVKVLEPKELAEEIKGIAEKMRKRYEE